MMQPVSASISPPPVDMGESPPTRSVRVSSVSHHDDVDMDAHSIDTTDHSAKKYSLPFFSISRFFRGPTPPGSDNHSSSSSIPSSSNDASDGYATAVPAMSEPDDSRSDVPSLSSLEAGDYYTHREDIMMEDIMLEPPAVPLTMEEEKSRSFWNVYPSHFSPPSCGDETDSDSNDSQQDQPQRHPSSHAILDRSNILFPTVSKSRDQQSCTTYMFSVFVGIVTLMVLIVFLLMARFA